MPRLEPEAFLTAVSKLFVQNRSGSIRMVYKLYVPKTGKLAGRKCCLVRAEGGKEKISTVISENEKKQFVNC